MIFLRLERGIFLGLWDLYDKGDIWIFDQSFDLSATLLQQDEVSDIKWVTSSELDSIYNSNMLVPTLSYYKEIL